MGELGISWKLLAAQGVNFFIVLMVLTLFLWRPLLAIMHARKKKIEDGLREAREAGERLLEIERMKDERMTEAEREALVLVSKAEKTAHAHSAGIIAGAEKKAEAVLEEGLTILKHKRDEEFARLAREAGAIIRKAIAESVALHPEKVDEVLVTEALRALKKEIPS